VPPILLLALEATYHTATLLWGLPPETKDATNQTYSVIYWNYEDPNTTYSVNVGQDTEIGQTMRYILTGLNPGLLYQWTVEASTAETMSLQSVVSNFSTMSVGETDSHFYAWFCYRITGGFNCVFAAKLERLSVRVYNSSSVLVTWAAPQLPSGVRVHSYTVHYAGTAPSGSGRLTVWEGPAVVAGLRSHSFYQFWVRAAVVEGSIQSDGIISSENATVFVPDSTIVQLRGGPFKPCCNWTVTTEVEVLDAFRRAIYEAIYGDVKDDDRGRELIERDFVLCEDSSSGGSQAVYRGSVFSSPGLTTETISRLLEQQVVTGELSGVVVDKTCPVSLFRTSEPLCRPPPSTQHQDLDKDCQKRDQGTKTVAGSLATTTNCTSRQLADEDTTVTVPLLAMALVAELFLVVFVVLLVTASVMVVRRRRWVSRKPPFSSVGVPH
jgi:hypothetical protein